MTKRWAQSAHLLSVAVALCSLAASQALAQETATATATATAVATPAPETVVMSVAESARALGEIERALRRRDLAAAREQAARLRTARVEHSGESIELDPSLLIAIENANAPSPALANRVARLVRALESVGGESHSRGEPAPSKEHAKSAAQNLERLRKAEELAPRPKGGLFPEPDERLIEPAEGFAALLEPITQAIERWLKKLIDWLFPSLQTNRTASSFNVAATWAAIALAVAIAIYAVVRLVRGSRSQRARAVASEGKALPPAADDDPMSREASEWEVYAAELTRAGRLREAVRAWYHAVLVALYRAGYAQERKGRTNWELVATLPPALVWRGDFADLTRRFEREWYGRDESEFEALDHVSSLALDLLGSIAQKVAA